MATGDTLNSAKALWGGVVGFVAPGAAYLLTRLEDGITGNELIGAGLTAVVTAAGVSATVWAVENRPKRQTLPPAEAYEDQL
jgi:hypothetical protein